MPKGGHMDDRESGAARRLRESKIRLDAVKADAKAAIAANSDLPKALALRTALNDQRERILRLDEDIREIMAESGIDIASRADQLADVDAQIAEVNVRIALAERVDEALQLVLELADRHLSAGQRTYAKGRLGELVAAGLSDRVREVSEGALAREMEE